jgi:hypothetical protein
MIKRVLMLGMAISLAACNSGPPGSATNTVGGADIASSAKAPMSKDTTNLSLDWGKNAKAGEVAIADVLTYGGPKVTITPPAGWQLIRDDSTATTRQSLYWHAIGANDSSPATWEFGSPVDAQGAIILLDNVAQGSPVDMSNGKTGSGGDVKSSALTTTADGDLVLIFNATDFGNAPLAAQTPSDMSAVVSQDEQPNEYWIISTWQNQNGPTEETDFSFPQLFNWVAAQVAIKHGSH